MTSSTYDLLEVYLWTWQKICHTPISSQYPLWLFLPFFPSVDKMWNALPLEEVDADNTDSFQCIIHCITWQITRYHIRYFQSTKTKSLQLILFIHAKCLCEIAFLKTGEWNVYQSPVHGVFTSSHDEGEDEVQVGVFSFHSEALFPGQCNITQHLVHCYGLWWCEWLRGYGVPLQILKVLGWIPVISLSNFCVLFKRVSSFPFWRWHCVVGSCVTYTWNFKIFYNHFFCD